MADTAPGDSTATQHPIGADILAAANINVRSGLATDYLNHFTEVIMLLELVADMPEMIAEIRAWRPKTYAEHFQASSFAGRDLAIEAYERAPAAYRVPFDTVVARLHARLARGIADIEAALGDPASLATAAAGVVAAIQALIQEASDLIHGNIAALDQSAVDAIFSN